jgi:hypothetical protein
VVAHAADGPHHDGVGGREDRPVERREVGRRAEARGAPGIIVSPMPSMIRRMPANASALVTGPGNDRKTAPSTATTMSATAAGMATPRTRDRALNQVGTMVT